MSYSVSPTCPTCHSGAPQTAWCTSVNPVGECALATQQIPHRHHRCTEYGCRRWWVEVRDEPVKAKTA